MRDPPYYLNINYIILERIFLSLLTKVDIFSAYFKEQTVNN